MSYTLRNGELQRDGKNLLCPFIPAIPMIDKISGTMKPKFQSCCAACVHFEIGQIPASKLGWSKGEEIDDPLIDVVQLSCGSGKVMPVTILPAEEEKPGPKLVKPN